MKDYYKILGVNKKASEEEIRTRWIELVKLHHPDLNRGGLNDKKIKEINEAYEVLKDYSKRLEYDFKRAHKKTLIKKVRGVRERGNLIHRIILLGGVLMFILLIGFILYRWSPPTQPLPSETHDLTPISSPDSSSGIERELKQAPPLPILKKETELKGEVAQEIVQNKVVPQRVEVPKKVPEGILQEVPKEFPQKNPDEIPQEVYQEVSTMIPKEISKEALQAEAQGTPQETPKELIKATQRVTPEPLPVPKSEPKVIEEKVISPPPSPLVQEEEVKQFFANYIDCYIRRDIQGFLSLFSPKAIQNQREGYEEIRKIYTIFFNKSQELYYDIKNVRIGNFQNQVEVQARFKVNQILRKRGEEKIWRGTIRWVLSKEDGVLKIVALDYKNEKSP